MSKVIAWTGFGTYPPFINISADEKTVRVYVRSAEALDNDGVSPGSAAVIEMSIAEFRDIAVKALWLTRPDARASEPPGREPTHEIDQTLDGDGFPVQR